MVKKHILDFVLLIIFGCLALAYWYPIRYLPYHLDTATFLINGTKALQERNFTPLSLGEFESVHPPLFMVLLSQWWKVLGESPAVSHAFMIPLATVLFFSTYKTCRIKLSTNASILTTFLLAFSPIIVTEFQTISVNIAIAAIAVTVLFFWCTKRYQLALGIIAVATWLHWSILFILPGLIFDAQYQKVKLRRQLFLIPFLAWVVWVLYHYSATGWVLVSPMVRWSPPPSLSILLSYAAFVLKQNLLNNYYWLIFPLGISAGLWGIYAKILDKLTIRLLYLTLISLGTLTLFYSVTGNFSLAQSLFLLPLLYVSVVHVLQDLVDSYLGSDYSWLLLVFVGLLGVIGLMRWRVPLKADQTLIFGKDNTLAYQDLLQVSRQAAGVLEARYYHAEIFGTYPEGSYLTEPYQGYVTKPLNFKTCTDYKFNSDKTQILYLHGMHPSQQVCHALLSKYVAVPLQKFEQNGRWIELFTITATKSAEVNQSN